MVMLRRVVINFSHFSKRRICPQTLFLPLTSRSLPGCQYQEFSSSPVKLKDEEIPSSLFKYQNFPEKTGPVILDVEEERQKIVQEEDDYDEFRGISLERGVTGVIDVEEVVEILKREKAQDLIVLKVPSEYNYADYMVIVTGRSHRHMVAMGTFIRKLYKRRLCGDKVPNLEGKNSKEWVALDLGNIILHIFSLEGRQIYDLETLWCVGKEFDSHTQQTEAFSNKLSNYKELLESLTPKS